MIAEEEEAFVRFDGRTVKRPKARHVIADIHYEPRNGPAWSECTCGRRFDADSPDALAGEWGAHRKGVRGRFRA